MRAAGRLALRCCPRCNTPIQKNGGCNRISCPCGADFDWTLARPLRPCRRCHVQADVGLIGRWNTCPYCSKAARVQAAAAKVGTATFVGAPLGAAALGVAAVAVGVGVTVAVLPAATFGPLALAYEPVRRVRGARTNPFAKAAASGAMLAGYAVVMCLYAGSDSD